MKITERAQSENQGSLASTKIHYEDKSPESFSSIPYKAQWSHMEVGRDTHTVASAKTSNASSAANF